MLVHTSVVTRSAPRDRFERIPKRSQCMARRLPRAPARARSRAGVDTWKWKSKIRAACSHVLHTLLESPTQATVLPDRPALLDEGEDVSQDLTGMILVGQPLITGTRE